MKHSTRSLLAAALLGCCATASAQNYYEPAYQPNYAYRFNPGTGDAVLDALLLSLNVYYASDVEWYVDDIVYSTGAPRAYVQTLIVEHHYPPADVYLIAQTANISGRPIAYVQREFDTHRGQGWGVVAKRLGIKPGSAEFHRLKSGADSWSSRATVKVKQKGGNAAARRVTTTTHSTVIVDGHAKAGHPAQGKGKPDKGNGNGKNKGKGNDNGNGKKK